MATSRELYSTQAALAKLQVEEKTADKKISVNDYIAFTHRLLVELRTETLKVIDKLKIIRAERNYDLLDNLTTVLDQQFRIAREQIVKGESLNLAESAKALFDKLREEFIENDNARKGIDKTIQSYSNAKKAGEESKRAGEEAKIARERYQHFEEKEQRARQEANEHDAKKRQLQAEVAAINEYRKREKELLAQGVSQVLKRAAEEHPVTIMKLSK